ncbi:MAG: energy-coupling factor transporter transmembrane protein EcfT [Lachnospiraceae bacterium]|nr:energy-coupling factor transporter transmembrane protein EcfT [Lachnospiraceae bacterium]
MIRDITLGQYYPAGSILHKLDPRVKLLGTMIFLIAVFSYRGIPGLVCITVCLAALIKLSKVPFSYMVKGLRAIVVLLALTCVFNLFLTPGEVVFSFWKVTITKEGINLSFRMVLRLIYLILGTSLMTLTTTPNQLTDGLEQGLKPLNRIHIPVHELAMMMSIALRFIPILIEETDKIMKAQTARGANFDEGGLIQKAKSMVPLLVPLFISAFRRANDLALAMEARCYHGGEGRTKLHPLRYQTRDYVAYVLMLVFLAGVVALRFFSS